MATEGFTFHVPDNYTNITVTAVVRGVGGVTLGTVTQTSNISLAVAAAFGVDAAGSCFDPIQGTVLNTTSTPTGTPTPVTTYRWFLDDVLLPNETAESYSTPSNVTGVVKSEVTVSNIKGSETQTVQFGTVGSEPTVSGDPIASTFDSVTGTPHSVNIIVNGVPDPIDSYGWNFGGTTVSNNSTNTFTPTNGNTGPLLANYNVVNRHGTKTGTVDFGTVGDIPSILAIGNPTEASGSTVGDVLTVNVVTYCTPAPTLVYAWYTDGTVVSGQTSNTYTTTSAATTSHCLVTAANRHGSTVNQVNFGEIRVATAAPTFGTPSPTISPAVGQLSDGETARILSVNPAGTPTPAVTYAWTKTTSLGTGTVGTNSSSYTAQTIDVGATIDCLVTLSNGVSPNATQTFTWGAVLASDSEVAPSFGNPQPTQSPASGSLNVGELARILGVNAVGTPTPSTTYAWSRETGLATVAVGTNSNSYTPVEDDRGNTLECLVTLNNNAGATTANFGFDAVLPALQSPTFTGSPSASDTDPVLGDLASIQNVGATGYEDPIVTYQWYINGVTIDGETSVSYLTDVVGALVGKITATNNSGVASSDVSFGNVGVAPTFTSPTPTPNFGANLIEVGDTALINSLSSTGTAPITTSYQWRTVPNTTGSVSVVGTNSSYTVQSADDSKDLECTITLSNGYDPDATFVVDFGTVQSPAVGISPTFTNTPSASDTNPDVGDRLEFENYGSTGTTPITTTFQWYDDGVTIDGATGYGYVVGATGDIAAGEVTHVVTASGSDYFIIDGVDQPQLSFKRGIRYIFDLSDTSVSDHPFALSGVQDGGNTYGNGWSTSGTQGTSGAYAQFIPPTTASNASLWYMCTSHTGMGNRIGLSSVENATIAGNIDGIVTITNSSGSTSSTVDFGTIAGVLTAPFFASGPTADAHDINIGDVATVVGAIGGNPTPEVSYTWTLDGSVIAGAESSTYTTTTIGTELLAGISASNSEGTITGTADFGTVSVGSTPGTTYGSLTDLRNIIDNASAGTTLDLNGGLYTLMGSTQASALGLSADFDNTTDWNGLEVDKNLNITNGTVSFYESHTPTDAGGGLFTVPNNTNEPFIQMFDPDAADPLVRLATYPPQFDNRTTTFSVDAASFSLNSRRPDDVAVYGDLPVSGQCRMVEESGTFYLSGFEVTDQSLVADIKTMLDDIVTNESGSYSTRSEAVAGIGLVMNINPNSIRLETVGVYSEGTSGSDEILGFTFAGETSDWTSRSSDSHYINEFNFFGRPSFGLTGGTSGYYTYDDTTITYSPASGACDTLYLPRVSSNPYHGWKITHSGSNTFKNITSIGAGKFVSTHADDHFYQVQGGHDLKLDTITTYMGSGVYHKAPGGGTVDSSNCRFIGAALNGFYSSSDSAMIFDRCEFRGGLYSNSAMGRLNADSIGSVPIGTPIPPLKVTNCYFNFDANHGQAISAYAGSWINTEITGNVFVNLSRPVSLQWETNAEQHKFTDLSIYGGFTFDNNLVYVNQLPRKIVRGQVGLSYNGETPNIFALELSTPIAGGPTEDGKYGITGSFTSGANNSAWYVRRADGNLDNVALKLNNNGYRIDGGTAYLTGTIVDDWDYVTNQTNYLDTIDRIEAHVNQFNGSIELYRGASGPTSDTIQTATVATTNFAHNIPQIKFSRNTVIPSRDLIEEHGVTAHEFLSNLTLNMNGRSSGIGRNVSSGGPMVITDNVWARTSNIKSTHKPGLSGGYDVVDGSTITDTSADGIYSLNQTLQNIKAGEDGHTIDNNTFFSYDSFAEGFVDGYSGGTIQRRNYLSNAFGGTLDEIYDSSGNVGDSAGYLALWDTVLDWNNGQGTVETKAGYSGCGIVWTNYPKFDDVESLGYTFSDVYTPIEEPFTTITQNITGYDGTQTAFSWTVNTEAIGSTGTFADGSQWVVPASGKTLRLFSSTPSNKIEHETITNFSQTFGLTVYRDGVSINEKVGREYNSMEDLIADNNAQVTGGWRTTDNRHSAVYGTSTPIQDQIDEYFDISTFEARKTILDSGVGGSGITLSEEDSIVLTRSYWDASDTSDAGSWSNGIPLTGEDTRTAVAQTAVLSVLSTAPSEPCFRPPIQWSDSDRANRPMYPVSDFDHTNWGITQGHAAHSSSDNGTPITVSLDRLMSSPFIHSEGGYVYASSFPREAFCDTNSGYGGDVAGAFGRAISEVYNTSITDETDESKLNLLYRFVQYGIDHLGTLSRRARTESGAGQRPALSAPWMQLAASALGVTNGINSVVRTFLPGASSLPDGSTSMAALKQHLFHDDFCLRQITTGTPDNWSTVGYTACGNHLGTSGGWGATLDLSNINGGALADFDTNNVLEPKDGSDGDQIPYTYPLETGMGRLDFTNTPMNVVETVDLNGTSVHTLDSSPKGTYNSDYVGCRLGIKQTPSDPEVIYTITMLTRDAGAYDVLGGATSSGACSFWLDRPLTAQPDSSSEIRIYPFTTADNGAWTFTMGGALRPDGVGAGLSTTSVMGIVQSASPSLQSAGYERVSARAWIPVYTLLRNNYVKMGLPTSKIGEAMDGYMSTMLEHTTGTDRRWQLTYGGQNSWFNDVRPAYDAEYWLSHSSITSDSKYYLPSTALSAQATGTTYYAAQFEILPEAGAAQTLKPVPSSYTELIGSSNRYDIGVYNQKALVMGANGSSNPVIEHWFSLESGGPISLGSFDTIDDLISDYESLPGGTIDSIWSIDGTTWPGIAEMERVSVNNDSLGRFTVTFPSGASADQFRTAALGLSGSGLTVGVSYTPNYDAAFSNTITYSITHTEDGDP